MRPCPGLLPLLLTATLAAQSDRPVSLPVNVTATIDAAPLVATGTTQLRLKFVCEETLDRAWSLRVELRRGSRLILRRDHAPPVPTKQWPKGKAVEYSLPIAFRTPPANVVAGDTIEVALGFRDPAGDTISPPLARSAGADGLVTLTTFVFPDLSGTPDAAAVDAAIAAAQALAAKQPHEAWDQLEFTFRRLDDYPLKAKLRNALTAIGRMPPAALTFEENDIVQGRIGAERARYLRQVAGRMHDRGKLLGALLLLDEVGGRLAEDADRAVLGALGEAQRVTQDRDGIAAKVFALTKEQQDEVEALASKLPGKERLAAGLALVKDRSKRPVGRELIRTLEFTPELREPAQAARAQVEKDWLADVPSDERAEAEAAMNHPCWARTAPRVSHRFVLIGPKQLVDSIPDDSLLRFDLAYLYLTDLFGRVPNPDGDRVTVYWKELWEFGGGVGGGKIIDIGNAKADAKDTRTDTGLLYHELTHCIDDTAPVYGGMREGLADFGAAFCQMELGQVGPGRAAIGLALRAFLGDYLERDLEYWRIPNYGPSAGFFLHFLTTYGKDGDGYRWQLYRKFFRDYRGCKVDDARTPTLARAFAFHLVQAFGDAAFADLIRFRWPLVPNDLAAIRLEQDAARRNAGTGALDDFDGSPVPRDVLAKKLVKERADLAAWSQELGIVRDWWVIGPFRQEGTDADAFRFPPELEIDLAARYPSINHNPTWRQPGPKPVLVDDTGWLRFDFTYMDWTALYALTRVHAVRELDAFLHLRGDDELTVFVNDELVGKYDGGGGGLGPWRPARTVMLPDAIRFPIKLRAGDNKILVKIYNHTGPAGVTLAIAQRNGAPLTGWLPVTEPAPKQLAAIDFPDGRKWPSRFRAKFDTAGAHRKLDAEVGQWRTRNGVLEGFATAREVEWRKYTVRPGFPKDSPSNLAWLPEKATEHLDAFLLELDFPLAAAAPKLCVILQGDGMRDALCGWTLILDPDGNDKVRAYLERYDQRIYDSGTKPWKLDGKKGNTLELQWFGKRLSVKAGGEVLFDQAPLLPIPGKHRIGIATWGENLKLEAIELRGPVRTK
ncbi:MAG: hypothetical protein WAT39_11265 [Planctomycetota bacterium]